MVVVMNISVDNLDVSDGGDSISVGNDDDSDNGSKSVLAVIV